MLKTAKKAKSMAKSNKSKAKTTKKASKGRVLMALSGGIDSAVSAYKLIQAGYEVEAAFMKNWSSTNGLKYDGCPWLTDRQDALRVAAFLGIPMHTLNFEKEYEKTVMDYFFTEYKAGRTPNPDVMCNKEIKFKLLYKWAMKNGFDYMATGHYAQVKPIKDVLAGARRTSYTLTNSGAVDNSKMTKGSGNRSKTNRLSTSASSLNLNPSNSSDQLYALVRSADDFKDQTYFIYNILQSQLPHLLFPIGGLKKSAVKNLARRLKLPNADKKESMGLCFVGQIRLKDFLEQKLKIKPGPIVDINAPKSAGVAGKGRQQKIGEHQGLAFYTVGQRQGIRVGQNGPWFVVRKELKTNTLFVTNNPNDKALETKQVEIHSVNWISKPLALSPEFKAGSKNSLKSKGFAALGRYRHQGTLEKITIFELSKGHYKVEFARPQKAVASGQSLVLYDGKVCLGGGVIV
ncbi:tRNA-specific 2-thiouridylase [bacterium]|nr:MAG: tRNA-specific 2-thiouridylase [bacterium]